ncbi:MAG: hypothetical protein GF392_04785 [Candidatus Omnitrophica bacterium]|nr:hypothetical protein [Candidatus Omnitrophota bacterium]
MKKILICSAVAVVLVINSQERVSSQSLEEIRARARAEVREEMGISAPVNAPADRRATERERASSTGGSASRSVDDLLKQAALILAGIALLPAAIAKFRGRSFIAWWVLGVLFFPIALLASLFIRDRGKTGRDEPEPPAPVDIASGAAAQKAAAVSNRTFIRGFYDEVFKAGKLDTADDLLYDDYEGHGMFSDVRRGPAGFKAYYAGIFSAFPDIEYTIEDVVTDDNKAVVRWTARGTHGGQLHGIDPTGKRVTISGVSVYSIEKGRIRQSWENMSVTGLGEQLSCL